MCWLDVRVKDEKAKVKDMNKYLERPLVVVRDKVDGDSLTAEPSAATDPGDQDENYRSQHDPAETLATTLATQHLWM